MRVRVTVKGSTADGVCVMQSENKESLAIMLDEALHTSHGVYAGGALPLLWNEEKQCYQELIGGDEVEIEWLDSKD